MDRREFIKASVAGLIIVQAPTIIDSKNRIWLPNKLYWGPLDSVNQIHNEFTFTSKSLCDNYQRDIRIRLCLNKKAPHNRTQFISEDISLLRGEGLRRPV